MFSLRLSGINPLSVIARGLSRWPFSFIGAGKRSRTNRYTEQFLDELTHHITLPSLPVSDEEIARATHQDKGQRLVRRDQWEHLSRLIQYADDSRLSTPGGEVASLLLAYGARSDVTLSAEEAIRDDAELDLSGIEAMDAIPAEFPEDYVPSLIVALAHIDIGWAHKTYAGDKTAIEQRLRSKTHFKRATELLAPFDGVHFDAPSLAAARCALNAADPPMGHRLADDYQKLIDLDPDSPRHLRALGQHLLPIHGGSYSTLELEARRTAARTKDIWGAGAYTWVFLDALALDPHCLDLMDADFFIDGLSDILRLKPDQHTVNLLAAFCAITMAPSQDGPSLSDRSEKARSKLHNCLHWILTKYLHELHPLIWAQTLLAPGQATMMPSRNALVTRGHQTAMHIIATCFADDINSGFAITFSPKGLSRTPIL